MKADTKPDAPTNQFAISNQQKPQSPSTYRPTAEIIARFSNNI
jgi:hypothetical protein